MKIFLMRGLLREQRHWGEFPELLHQYVPNSEIVKLDLPGVGTEINKMSPSSIKGIVEDLRPRLKSLGTDRNTVCVSISLGAMVGMQWALDYVEDFRGLVIINTSSGGLSQPWERLRPQVIPNLFKSAVLPNPIDKETLILKATTNLPSDKIATLAKVWAGYTMSKNKVRETAVRQLSAAVKFALPDSKIQIPLQILYSQGDRLTHPSCSQKIARHFGVEPVAHPSAGHDLPLDDPQWTATQIATFIKSLTGI